MSLLHQRRGGVPRGSHQRAPTSCGALQRGGKASQRRIGKADRLEVPPRLRPWWRLSARARLGAPGRGETPILAEGGAGSAIFERSARRSRQNRCNRFGVCFEASESAFRDGWRVWSKRGGGNAIWRGLDAGRDARFHRWRSRRVDPSSVSVFRRHHQTRYLRSMRRRGCRREGVGRGAWVI